MNANREIWLKARSDAYSDLEPKIRDLTLMAELARYHAVNAFGVNPPGETKEEHQEREIALFATVHLMDMVSDLEKAYDAERSKAATQAPVTGAAIFEEEGR